MCKRKFVCFDDVPGKRKKDDNKLYLCFVLSGRFWFSSNNDLLPAAEKQNSKGKERRNETRKKRESTGSICVVRLARREKGETVLFQRVHFYESETSL